MNDAVSTYLAAIGARGGRSRSEKKLAAVRINGKKGGWPKGKPRKPVQNQQVKPL